VERTGFELSAPFVVCQTTAKCSTVRLRDGCSAFQFGLELVFADRLVFGASLNQDPNGKPGLTHFRVEMNNRLEHHQEH
jgi:hypothetical protein